jgi:hypothetical protein
VRVRQIGPHKVGVVTSLADATKRFETRRQLGGAALTHHQPPSIGSYRVESAAPSPPLRHLPHPPGAVAERGQDPLVIERGVLESIDREQPTIYEP